MKKAGIVFIVLQCFALIGGMETDSARRLVPGPYLRHLFTITGLSSIAEIFGYFLPLIVGILLLVMAQNKSRKKRNVRF